MTDATRLRLSERSDWSEEVGDILGQAEPPSLNVLYAIGHHPHLLGPFLAYSATIAMRGVLSRRDSEVLALRAAWNCRSEFEWGHHVHYAREAGISEAEIARLARSNEDGWSERDRLLVRAADELHDHKIVSEETWKCLRGELDEAQLIELLFVVGHYTMLSMLTNSAGVPLEEGFDRLPADLEAPERS